MMKIKEAKHLILWWMNLTGYRGIAFIWAIYLHPNNMNDARLIRHEREHEKQMNRDGRLFFLIKYVFWSVIHGYHNNPYEVAARRAEHVGYTI